MANFVLVHGSWHGGWCWKKMSPYLRKYGHEVYFPTLTGLGEKSHLISKNISLNTHIQDISQLIFYHDLTNVILVGHSYGGAVIRGVAEIIPKRIKRLVFLDACIPENNKTIFDILPGLEEIFKKRLLGEQSNGWLVAPYEPEIWGVKNSDVKWMKERLTPMPWHTHDQPIQIKNPEARMISKSYISCTKYKESQFIAKKVKSSKEWDYHELDTGHDAMVIIPKELASLLNDLVKLQDI
ncbi:MAG: alpha/beta hydrolase [Nitrososphaeraceae archaeon]|nr:alpha/beta hydrolase [Nitrososphaeraceae archaeon]